MWLTVPFAIWEVGPRSYKRPALELYIYIFVSFGDMATPPTFGGSQAFSKVEVSVTCQNLKDLDYFSKSDPCVFLFEYMNRNWAKVGRTEVIDNNLNPKVSSVS